MASSGAVPFWRGAGMTYITYSNICANMVRNCLKEPFKSDVINREKVHFSLTKWIHAKPQKPTIAAAILWFWKAPHRHRDHNCGHIFPQFSATAI